MKWKIVLAILISTLMMGSIFTSAANVKVSKSLAENDNLHFTSLSTGEIEVINIYVGNMTINSKAKYENERVIPKVVDHYCTEIHPYGEDIVKLNITADCIILNERVGIVPKTDIWEFEIATWGDDKLGGLINTRTITDELSPWETPIEFTMNVSKIVCRDDFLDEEGRPEMLRSFYVNLICRYTCIADDIQDERMDSSDPYQFTVKLLNEDPFEPALSGTFGGTAGMEYTYTLLSNGDPEHDEVKYRIDWGDDTNDYTYTDTSGLMFSDTMTHTWASEGIYSIYISAEDCFGGYVDTTLSVTMPKSKSSINPLFLDFLKERFPLLEQLFQRMTPRSLNIQIQVA